MNYQTFEPHSDLRSLVKCYWTLEVPAETPPVRQRILPDGCIEMIFILGDDIKRYTIKEDYILQPRAMVLGQITEPFFVEPTGAVHSFAARFYPYGFANFTAIPLKELANKETPVSLLFGESAAGALEQQMINAPDTQARISVVEDFLLQKLKDANVIDTIVKTTVDTMLQTNGSLPINTMLKGELSKRRQLERKFAHQIGLSPKQLGKVIRLQTALKLLLNRQAESLTQIAYDSEYYDQAHFIRDFKEFTGVSPKDFLGDGEMLLSTVFYEKD